MTNVNGNWKKSLKKQTKSAKKWAVGIGKKTTGEQRFLGKTLPKKIKHTKTKLKNLKRILNAVVNMVVKDLELVDLLELRLKSCGNLWKKWQLNTNILL